MSRSQRFAVAGAIWALALTFRAIAVEIFGPESTFRALTSGYQVGDATSSSVHSQIYAICGVWLPLGLIAFAIIWVIAMEFRTQQVGRRLYR